MRVLWITNILFPEISNELGIKVHSTGGWMHSSANSLLNLYENLELAIAALYEGDKLLVKKINNITYYCLPFAQNPIKYNSKIEVVWKDVRDSFKPDIVHIHGTEFAHGLGYIKACGSSNVVISIQGLVSVYSRYSLGGISVFDLLRKITLYDIIRSSIISLPKTMFKQGQIEKEYLQLCNNIIGRTDWDYCHVKAINRRIKYHHCNETLRKSFYDFNWDINKCEKYTIFLSQAYIPIKGIHILIEALPLIIKRFPDTKIFVSGGDFINKKTLKDRLKLTSYSRYVQCRINKYGLEDYFEFTGNLSESEMCQRYLKSHVFICPSSIENSPNSLGEAQLLGVPNIGSYVGGTPNMIEHSNNGFLYRFEEYEMLAMYVCKLFDSDELAVKISESAKITASHRHNPFLNALQTMEVYKTI